MVCDCLVTLSLTTNETLKRLSSLPILMQESFWCWQCSDRYMISLFPHLHTPHPPPSPSLISLVVSMDAKHNVYLLWSQYLRHRRPVQLGDAASVRGWDCRCLHQNDVTLLPAAILQHLCRGDGSLWSLDPLCSDACVQCAALVKSLACCPNSKQRPSSKHCHNWLRHRSRKTDRWIISVLTLAFSVLLWCKV